MLLHVIALLHIVVLLYIIVLLHVVVLLHVKVLLHVVVCDQSFQSRWLCTLNSDALLHSMPSVNPSADELLLGVAKAQQLVMSLTVL